MTKLRWGILSTARIGTEKVIPALQRSAAGEVVALASRREAAAQEAAERLGIARAYGSYEALLADPTVEAVYNPLPNDLHVPWTIRALEAGKHVLCEKPVGLDAGEVEKLVAAARAYPRLRVMEAFMYRFHPQWERVQALVRDGAVGRLRAVQTFFSYHNADPDNIRNRPEHGGGALMDIGCYGISVARFLFGAEPRRVWGTSDVDPRFGTDRLTTAVLDFGEGTATFTCATQAAPHQRVDVVGTDGRIEVPMPFNPPPDTPARLRLVRGGDADDLVFDAADQYTRQGDRFARAVREDAPVPTPLTDALANMRVLDAVRASARTGRPAERRGDAYAVDA